MSEDRASSYRFFVQMIINIFLCKKAQEIIGKRVMKEEKLSKKSYIIYVVFALTLFIVNQSVYMFFKDQNLYEKIGASRMLNIVELKAWGFEKKSQLLTQYSQNPHEV